MIVRTVPAGERGVAWRDDPQASAKVWGWAGYCPVHSMIWNHHSA